MSKIKELIQEEEEAKIKSLNEDLSWEHEQHNIFTLHCELCQIEADIVNENDYEVDMTSSDPTYYDDYLQDRSRMLN